MVLSPVQLWRRFSKTVRLFLISALLTVVLYGQIHSVESRTSTVSASKTSDSLAIKPSSPVLTHSIEQQATALHRLYQAAPKLSVDELVLHEESKSGRRSNWGITSYPTPAQYRINAHSSNFGDRLTHNSQRRLLRNKLLIVLHETTSAASGAVNTVLTPHARDEDQISYHTVICQDGTILYLVDPRKRAYGAGNSAFRGRDGLETVQTNKRLNASVNNFAYHISLETPPDGYHDKPEHAGYSEAQYTSLAWLIARSGVEDNRITTHFAIDQSGERQDPRSFEMSWLQQNLAFETMGIAFLGATP